MLQFGMTCICAVTDGNEVVMGGDSAMSDEDGDRSLRSPKVFEKQSMLFGVSGEMRIGQLIQHVYEVAAPSEHQNLDQFIMRDFCQGLRIFLQEHADELLPSQDGDEMWRLLVGVQGRIFQICSHMSVSESITGYDAIGSATPHALGSLASTEGSPIKDRVQTALRAAERHHGTVASPFTILRLGYP